MIEGRNLSFSYGKTPILENLHFTLQTGKLYALVGVNGSGKTTLIKLLSAQLKPAVGELFLAGKPYSAFSPKDFARSLALLPQGREVPNMSVYELVACARYPYLSYPRRLSKGDKELIYASLQRTNCLDLAQRNVQSLSGGQRQQVYMAMLYAQDTPCVLLDEPTTYLDLSSAFQLMSALREMAQSGKCVVAVLHDLSLALRYADCILLLDGGRLVSAASPAETIERGVLPSFFGVDCLPIDIKGRREYIFRPI